jgi:hypothetical protein
MFKQPGQLRRCVGFLESLFQNRLRSIRLRVVERRCDGFVFLPSSSLQEVVGQAHATALRDRFDRMLAVCVESGEGQFGSFRVAQVDRDFAPCVADDQFTAAMNRRKHDS